jgi:flagellar biosynthesis/type III secretory pathway chaperone
VSVNRSLARAKDASGWVAEALEQLLESLSSERDALMRDDLDLLAQAVSHKEQTLRRLATGLKSSDAPALREAFRSLRDLNERNARLLLPRIRINQARVAALLGATRTGALYSPNGRAAGADSRPVQRGVRA